jgi:hypothetical protein
MRDELDMYIKAGELHGRLMYAGVKMCYFNRKPLVVHEYVKYRISLRKFMLNENYVIV